MKGVLDEQIPANERFIEHIDLCLTCRTCERVCPNHVRFGELVGGMRERIAPLRPPLARWLGKAARALLVRPWVLEMLAPLVAICRASGVGRVLPKTLTTWLASAAWRPRFRAFYPARGQARGKVALFLGCVARVFDNETLHSAIFVLNRLGYDVSMPRSQTCCGALSRQAGDLDEANKLAQRNVKAFANVEAIVTTASGCGLALREYGEDYGEHAFSAKAIDISDFLAKLPELDGIGRFAARVAIHEPCSARQSASVRQLLNRIPGMTAAPLGGNDQCCGAAGMYFLTQPAIAESLRQDKAQAFVESGAQILVTSNIGCALHLKAAGIDAVHPVTLLARHHARP